MHIIEEAWMKFGKFENLMTDPCQSFLLLLKHHHQPTSTSITPISFRLFSILGSDYIKITNLLQSYLTFGAIHHNFYTHRERLEIFTDICQSNDGIFEWQVWCNKRVMFCFLLSEKNLSNDSYRKVRVFLFCRFREIRDEEVLGLGWNGNCEIFSLGWDLGWDSDLWEILLLVDKSDFVEVCCS